MYRFLATMLVLTSTALGAQTNTDTQPSMSATAEEVISVSPTPTSPTPVEVLAVPSPTPLVQSPPSAVTLASPAPIATPTLAEVSAQVKAACDESFASSYQDKLKPICIEGATLAAAKNLQTSSEICYISHKDQERARLVCMIGASIGEDIRNKQTFYKDKISACRDLYPITTQIDVYLQEACLTGIHQRLAGTNKPSLQLCRNVSNDRGFVAPCGVGLSIAYDMALAKTGKANPRSIEQNQNCLKYFDKAAFHLGYRSCLNARSLILEDRGKKRDIVKQCNDIISNNKSEAERAACIVGSSLYAGLERNAQATLLRFKNCGETKVNYDEHSTLACLTAVSLLDFMDKDHARKACKEVFTARKSHSRDNCIGALR